MYGGAVRAKVLGTDSVLVFDGDALQDDAHYELLLPAFAGQPATAPAPEPRSADGHASTAMDLTATVAAAPAGAASAPPAAAAAAEPASATGPEHAQPTGAHQAQSAAQAPSHSAPGAPPEAAAQAMDTDGAGETVIVRDEAGEVVATIDDSDLESSSSRRDSRVEAVGLTPVVAAQRRY